LIEIEEIRGFDIVFGRPVLGVLGAGFGKRQQKRKNRDDERDRLTFFLRLDRGIGGFRHGLPSHESPACFSPAPLALARLGFGLGDPEESERPEANGLWIEPGRKRGRQSMSIAISVDSNQLQKIRKRVKLARWRILRFCMPENADACPDAAVAAGKRAREIFFPENPV
jgi:hypothetical protein